MMSFLVYVIFQMFLTVQLGHKSTRPVFIIFFPDKIILLKNRPYFTQNALQRQIGLQVVNGQINSTLIFSSILRESEFGCWENLRLKKDILVFQGCILLEKDWTKLKNLHVFVNWTSSTTQQKCEMGFEISNVGGQNIDNLRNIKESLGKKVKQCKERIQKFDFQNYSIFILKW